MIEKDNTINSLKNIVQKFVDEREWSQFHNAKNLSMALAIEASELMDIYKCDTSKSCAQKMSNKESREAAIDELADIIIYAIAFANKNNIDISEAVSKKMIKNRIKYPMDKFKGNF